MKKSFDIDNSIYPKNFIKQTIIDFKDFCDISFDDGKISIIGNNDDEIIEIFNEFMNYTIGLINEKI